MVYTLSNQVGKENLALNIMDFNGSVPLYFVVMVTCVFFVPSVKFTFISCPRHTAVSKRS